MRRTRVCRGREPDGTPCPNPTSDRRGFCGEHRRQSGGRSHNPLYDSYAWRKRRKLELAKHRARYGDMCPGFRRSPHPSKALTLDHVVPLGLGGSIDGPTRVLCASCNTRAGNAAMPRGFALRRPP
jgi:5-methylcytosine-specific restriction protein A